MKKVDLRKALVLLSVTFIFLCLAGEMAPAQMDTADVEIGWTNAYPGHFHKMEVRLKTPKVIAGFQFMITISTPELMNFHTDSIRIKPVAVRVDTCTGPPPHDSLCFKDSLVPAPVRFCYIDTTSSLISGLPYWEISCHGDTADTSKPACKWVEVFGYAKHDTTGQHQYPIQPTGNYQTLFRLGVDAFCISDTIADSNRWVSFYMSPQHNSFLSDPNGNVVPFRYNLGQGGQLTVWWSRPGDANGDSVVNVGDVMFLINYLFKGGPRPCVPEAADANGNCVVEVGDITTLVSYLFKAGNAPIPGCWHGKKEE